MARRSDKPAAPDLAWPLTQRGAHEAATYLSEPMAKWPRDHRRFRNLLAGRLIGAVDREDMQRRVDEFSAGFRRTLPEDEEQGP